MLLSLEELVEAIVITKEKVISIEQLITNSYFQNNEDTKSVFLPIKDAAKFLHLSKSTLYRLVSK